MAIKYTKKDEYTLQVEQPKMVEKPSDIETEIRTYDYDFLLNQKEAITKQRNEIIALKEKELAEVENLITEAQKLGIMERIEKVIK